MLRVPSSDCNLSGFACPKCGARSSFVHHGPYTRFLITGEGERGRSVKRVRCRECGATHAVLPYEIAPRKQYSASTMRSVYADWTSGKMKVVEIREKHSIGTTTLYRLTKAAVHLRAYQHCLAIDPPRSRTLRFWLNLQNAYDAVLAEIASEEILEEEISILKQIGYSYFKEWFHLPDLPRKLKDQVAEVRKFLGVATLTVLRNRDLFVSFRSASDDMDDKTIARANALVQIAENEARKVNAPKYDKAKFESAVDFALTQTTNHEGFSHWSRRHSSRLASC